jgi:hypothetical protein
MRATAALVIFGCALVCCRDNIVVREVPAEIAYVALLYESEGGELLSGTPLRDYQSGETVLGFSLEGEFERTRVVGFSAEQISALGAPAREELENDPLHAAAGCDPTLPAPIWSEVRSRSGDVVPVVQAAPALTADWFSRSCPADQLIDVDAICVQERCLAAIIQNNCTYSIELSGCGLGRISGRLDRLGRFCAERVEPAHCSFIDPPRDTSVASVECGVPSPCELEVFADPGLPDLELAEVRVVEGVLPEEPSVPRENRLQHWFRDTGWFTDFAIAGDRLVVAARGADDFLGNRACRIGAPMVLATFDVATLAPLGSKAAPPCLMRLVAHPERAAVFGVYYEGSRYHLGEFAVADGALSSSSPITLPASELREYFAIDAVWSAPTREVLLLFVSAAHDHSVIVAIDADSGSQEVLFDEAGASSNTLAVSASGVLAFDSKRDDTIEDNLGVKFFDLVGRTSLGIWAINTTKSVVNVSLIYHPGSDRFFLVSPGEDPLIHPLQDEDPLVPGRRLPVTRGFGPYSGVPDPRDPRRLLIGAVSLDELTPRTGLIATYDPRDHVFVPGMRAIGFGPPSAAKSGAGFAWMSFPWEGVIRRWGAR